MLAIIDNELVIIEYGYRSIFDIPFYHARYISSTASHMRWVDAAIEHFEPLK